jgi:hypothetical protein
VSVLGRDVDGDMVLFRSVSCHIVQCHSFSLTVFVSVTTPPRRVVPLLFKLGNEWLNEVLTQLNKSF